MYLKLLFAVVLLGISVFLMVRWKRRHIMLTALLLFVLLVPGNPGVCAMRLAVFSSLFVLYILWSGVLKMVRVPLLPLYVFSGGGVLLYEALMWIFGAGVRTVLWGYVLLNILVWCISWGYAFAVRGNNDALKGSLPVALLLEQGTVAFVFALVSGITMAGAFMFWEHALLHEVAASVFLVLFILYICYDRPLCLDVKQVGAVAVTRKRGYQSGKGGVGSRLLEEEGGGVTNEGIIEDSRIIYSLMSLFEREHLYRNVDVKIGNVALMLGTNKTYLSRALNTRLSKNFCQFVNYYRVKEACAVFIENPYLEMKDIAEQCGFSSSSNFSIVFKYNTGFSPGDWCRMVKLKLENNETVSLDDYLL